MSTFKGFDSVELTRPPRSTFNLSHEKRLSTRMGKLTPVFISETIPNDTFHGSTEVLIKLAPMLAPIYHRLNLYVHYFFVPNRLLWQDWEQFITGGRLGNEVTTPPLPPRFAIDSTLNKGADYMDIGTLADYLGVPPIPDTDAGAWVNRTIDAMPLAAYYKVWYDYYRDRNYVADNNVLPLPAGTLVDPLYTLWQTRYRAWEHDYFTSALPFTQRGDEVLMPLDGELGITYRPVSRVYAIGGGGAGTGNLETETANNPNLNVNGTFAYIDNIEDVSIEGSSVSINDLRRATQLQRWLELNSLGGSRYKETIMAHFGRNTSDGRLQRAEYLGGGKAVIQISEVMTTAYSEDASAEVVPPGNMAGRGSTYANTNKFSYNCEEHGFIIGILSVMPTSGYMQGWPRMFQQRDTQLDYPWPTFAHLGEQPVYDYEIYATPGTVKVDREENPIFGYQSRYSDWKFINSSSHGDFRNSLDFWHLTRKFSATPNLGSDFVTFEDSLQNRIFAVEDVDTLWLYVYNKINVKRSLPYFGTPRLG